MLSEKEIREIEMIYQTQVEHGMKVIQLNKIDFEKLLQIAKESLNK